MIRIFTEKIRISPTKLWRVCTVYVHVHHFGPHNVHVHIVQAYVRSVPVLMCVCACLCVFVPVCASVRACVALHSIIYSCLLFSACVSLVMMVLYATLRFELPKIFTSDPYVSPYCIHGQTASNNTESAHTHAYTSYIYTLKHNSCVILHVYRAYISIFYLM